MQNRYRPWTFEQLREYVSDHLCEEMGVESSISERTLVDDIRVMRKDAPRGYNAPIRRRNGLVFYDDPAFSIRQVPLTESDLARLQSALHILRQFSGLPHFDQLVPLVSRLKGYTRAQQLLAATGSKSIHFNYNSQLTGLEWLAPLSLRREIAALHRDGLRKNEDLL